MQCLKGSFILFLVIKTHTNTHTHAMKNNSETTQNFALDAQLDALFSGCDLTPKTPAEALEFERIANLVKFRAFDPAANILRERGLTPKIR